MDAIALARNLPKSITEFGLVDCGIGDVGGREILAWAKENPSLRMICIEQNNFGEKLRMEFRKMGRMKPEMMVVV